jgi:hypothetical protein
MPWRLFISSMALAGLALTLAGEPATSASTEPFVRPFEPRPEVVGCGGQLFSRAAMRSPGGAEKAPDPAAAALRQFFQRQGKDYRKGELPSHRGWRRLAATEQEVLFGWGPRAGRITYTVTAENKNGSWDVQYFGQCIPTLHVPGYEATWWHLPRLPSPRTNRLRIILETGSCSPGRAVADVRERLDHVEYARSGNMVRLLVLIRPPKLEPGYSCAGVGIDYVLRMRLPERIGRTVLLDASNVPSTRIADLRRGRCHACGRQRLDLFE